MEGRSLNTISCKIPITSFQQETEFSCGPAVARSVLFSLLQVELTESELISILETNEEIGTQRLSFKNILNGRHNFGALLDCQTGTNGSLERIRDLFEDDWIVIVNYIEPVDEDGHWAIVRSVVRDMLYLADPYHGYEFSLPKEAFLNRWHSGAPNEKGEIEEKPWVAFRRA